MSRLRNITISTTLTCNESCSHCWVSAGPRRSDDLATHELLAVLEQAAALGAEHVKFTGGEPLVRPDLVQLVHHAQACGLRVSVETNGLLLRGRLLDALCDHAAPHIYVSLDGAHAATHDGVRMRPGAFARTVSNLRLARDRGVYFSVHTVVRREILDELPALHELVRSLGASQHKLILSIHELGRGREYSGSAQASLREILGVLDRLPPQEFWDYGWNPEPTRETRLMTTLPPAFQPDGRAATTCGWGESFLSVLADGSVALCHGLYDFEEGIAGNVRSDSLADIWQHSDLFGAKASRTLSGVCGNCVVRDTCRGLCRASAIGKYRDVLAPYPTCQEIYNAGMFPQDMLDDPDRDCSYGAAV